MTKYQIVGTFDSDSDDTADAVASTFCTFLPYMVNNVEIKVISEFNDNVPSSRVFADFPPSPLEPFLRAAIEEQDRQIEAQIRMLMMMGNLTLDEVLGTWILDIEQVETPEALTYANDFDNLSVQWKAPYKYILRRRTIEELAVFNRMRVEAAKNAVKSEQRELDPKPWVYGLLPIEGDAQDPDNPNLTREAEQVTGGFAFFPRKQYEQDPRKYPSYVKYNKESK